MTEIIVLGALFCTHIFQGTIISAQSFVQGNHHKLTFIQFNIYARELSLYRITIQVELYEVFRPVKNR